MSASDFHRRRRSFSGTKALETLGASIAAIKKQDDLSWNDVGLVLGKQRETAAGYASGEGDMGLISFLLGTREWNGQFANAVMALIDMKIVPLDACHLPAAEAVLVIMRALVALQEATSAGGELSDDALRANRDAIEAAAQVFDGYRERLARTAG
ncbi:hypothetical protein [Sphingomonas sp. NFR15]|uniref:hypothetical protein n=1 Tax=Sphingomonas sp. NFR15 TaxID=1566282 RepID=UPI0008864A8C|nr:hypothetical protein [Sphingomonas sp. NFR15]SDA15077.1 hypothetical protein SAMN03159340_00637 [Sphingomonas sp. NFR15]